MYKLRGNDLIKNAGNLTRMEIHSVLGAYYEGIKTSMGRIFQGYNKEKGLEWRKIAEL